MAILSEQGNEYEVRIVRRPQNTYFDEHVKIGDRERPDAVECDRNIVAEPEQRYGIEVTLKSGFRWGEFDEVWVGLIFAGSALASCHVFERQPGQFGMKKDWKCTLERQVSKIAIANEYFSDEVDIQGVNPRDLTSFEVGVVRRKDNDPEYSTSNQSTPSDIWQAKKVDSESFKKHGIHHATSLEGSQTAPKFIFPNDLGDYKCAEKVVFSFHYSSSAFFEHVNIVPYPPPLYCYSWGNLREAERMLALTDLQLLSRAEDRVRAGSLPSHDEDRKDWRSWHAMNAGQRKFFFEKLQNEHKAYARGEVLKASATVRRSKVISLLDEDGPSIGTVESTRSESMNPNRRCRTRGVKQEPIDLENEGAPTARGIKTEPIDIEQLPTAPHIVWRAPTIKRTREDSDEREVKRVKSEEDVPADLSQYADFKQEEQSKHVVKLEGSISHELTNFEQAKREDADEELQGAVEKTAIGEEETEIGLDLEQEEIIEKEIKIDDQLADAIEAMAGGT
ncbi:hypothetical protein N431DRAFT_556570 [Stipitochalara longipes BDJ]|nr:hypothetical protein N431DRAFT_556570 [Stipitochalara longipes BDJ]